MIADESGAWPDNVRQSQSIAAQQCHAFWMTVPSDAGPLGAHPAFDEPYAVSHSKDEVRQSTVIPWRKLSRTGT